MTDLQQHIQAMPLMDTHEHLYREDKYVQDGPDVLQDLFQNYIEADLIVAGATPEAVARLINAADGDLWGDLPVYERRGSRASTRVTARPCV